jgi:hypothetical protein
LRSDGTLWAWGDNSSGQLGDGTVTMRIAPEQISTGFTVVPAVISTVPVNGAINVSTGTKIQAIFSEAMDATTITTSTFTVSGGVTGTVTFDTSTNTATFTPSSGLGQSTTYTATITTGVRDPSGDSPAADFTWSFTTEKSSKSNCFIATAAYGSYLDPHVGALRAFRDRYLMTNRAGRYFVERYYRYSPSLAAVIARHEALRSVTRWALTPLVFGAVHPFLFGLILLGAAGIVPAGRRVAVARTRRPDPVRTAGKAHRKTG